MQRGIGSNNIVKTSDRMSEVLNYDFVANISNSPQNVQYKMMGSELQQYPGSNQKLPPSQNYPGTAAYLPPIQRGQSAKVLEHPDGQIDDSFARADASSEMGVPLPRPNIGNFSDNSTRASLDRRLAPLPSISGNGGNSGAYAASLVGGPPQKSERFDGEVHTKVRHMELNLLDFKGAIDRRMNELSQDIPSRLQREIKAFELREQQLAKDMADKLSGFQDQQIRSRDHLKIKHRDLQEHLNKLEVHQQELDYKIGGLIKKVDLNSVYLQQATPGGGTALVTTAGAVGAQGALADNSTVIGSGNGLEHIKKFDYETQIRFLKDQMIEETKRREQMMQENQRNQQILQSTMRGIETDLMNRLKQQRDAHLTMFQQVEEEKARLYKAGGDKNEDNAHMLKTLLLTIERKVEEEIGMRQREQNDAKSNMEQKLVSLVEKLKSDEKQGLERERRLMEQVQEGLSTMNEIIRGTKEQSQVSMNHQNTVMGEQIGTQNQALEEIKSNVFNRQGVIEQELADSKQRIVNLEEATMKHVKDVNGVVESEMNRFEKVISAIEKHQVSSTDEFRKQIEQYSADNVKWRVDYEDINTKKLQEIHAALKVLNNQIGKGTTDWKERCDVLASELKLMENAIQAQLADVKDQIQDGDANLDERIQVATSRIQERVKIQIDENLLELKNRFNENLELIETKFKQNNSQIKAYVEKMSEQGLEKLKEDRKEKDTLLEGRAQAYTVESERKLVQKINLLFGRVDALKDTVSQKGFNVADVVGTGLSNNATNGDKQQVLAVVSENQDAGTREAAIKSWAMSQMKDNYGDFERLLAAKYNELKLMIDTKGDSRDDGLDGNPDEYALQDDMQRVLDWIDMHEPKINLLVTRVDAVEDAIHKVEVDFKGRIHTLENKYDEMVVDMADVARTDTIAELINKINAELSKMGGKPVAAPKSLLSRRQNFQTYKQQKLISQADNSKTNNSQKADNGSRMNTLNRYASVDEITEHLDGTEPKEGPINTYENDSYEGSDYERSASKQRLEKNIEENEDPIAVSVSNNAQNSELNTIVPISATAQKQKLDTSAAKRSPRAQSSKPQPLTEQKQQPGSVAIGGVNAAKPRQATPDGYEDDEFNKYDQFEER